MPHRSRDLETGLYNEQFFAGSVATRLAAAKRSLSPMSIVLVAIGGPSAGHVDASLIAAREVAYGLVRALREADLACRLDLGRFGLLLEETAVEGAAITVDRLRALLGARGGRRHLWAGIATYPTHGLDSVSLLTAADAALVDAMTHHESRIEIAPVPV